MKAPAKSRRESTPFKESLLEKSFYSDPGLCGGVKFASDLSNAQAQYSEAKRECFKTCCGKNDSCKNDGRNAGRSRPFGRTDQDIDTVSLSARRHHERDRIG